MISKKEWIKFIKCIRLGSTVELRNRENAVELLEKALINAIGQRIPNKGKIGVLFSGGVDSSTIALILKKLDEKFTCYSVGLENSEDILWAEKAAKKMGFRLKKRILAEKDVGGILNKIAGFLEDFDMVKAGVGCVTYAGAELAKKDKAKIIFTGLGSEEIFAGYQRHKEAVDVNEECWKGLLAMHKRDFMRDIPIADKLKIKIEVPFLDKEVIRIAMGIPSEYKLSSRQNKIILREVAEKIGLPKEFSQRKKRASQYGSRIDKAIERIARKNGFRKKSDYIKSLAVEKVL